MTSPARPTTKAGALTTLALVVGLIACRRPSPEPLDDVGPPPSDHLAENEVAEGKQRAFSLPLPRNATIAVRFPGAIHVNSDLAPEPLSNFVRARVKAGKMIVGATTTTFEDVIVPSEPARHITVEIRPGAPLTGVRSQMVVKDVTPPPPPPPDETPDERRRKAGLTPDGKLLDPLHMQ